MISRRRFNHAAAATAAGFLLGDFASAQTTRPRQQPNFVIFIGDDVSADFGCYGHPTAKTPNIDALAKRGVRFDNAYLTAPSCSPSRTSLLTGRYPHNTGGPELHMRKNPHLAGLAQFPHELRKAGYYTALAGKAHFNGNAGASFDRQYSPGDPSGMANWMDVLSDRPKDTPFLMWLSAIDAHRPWDMDISRGPHDADAAVVPPYLVDGERTRKDLALYYNEVHRFDRKIGEVVKELKAQGVYDNTVIIVMGDNGRPFPRCKTWVFDGGIKTPLIVSWPGKTDEAAACESLVSSVDIAPTVLEIAGLGKPKTMQGVSFNALLADPNQRVRDVVFAERNWHVYRHHDRMARHGKYVYIKNSTPGLIGFNSVQAIHNRPEAFTGDTASTDIIEGYWLNTLTDAQKFVTLAPSPTELLFDVEADPHQIDNLAAKPEHAEKLEQMRRLLAEWTEQTGDTTPPLDKMTPDRNDRRTGKSIQPKGRPPGGVAPGDATRAWTIHHPGPIRVD